MNNDKIVYHYTSLEGLIGIIDSKRIWATDIFYLNDASELNYSKDILYEEVKKLIKKDPRFELTEGSEVSLGAFYYEVLEENIESYFSSENLGFYVCSFSEEKDLLSQWRGYCQGGSGCSIGFSLARLKENFSQESFTISQCIYDKNKQVKLIKRFLKKASGKFISQVKDKFVKNDVLNIIIKFLAVASLSDFIKLAPIFKHPQFEEEKEWRVISSKQRLEAIELLKFRPGKTMIIPYVEFPLPVEDDRLVIDEIVIGPTSDNLLSVSSLKLLLESKRVICSKIISSTIPYRT